MRFTLLWASLGLASSSQAQLPSDHPICITLTQLDSVLFEQGFNRCRLDLVDSVVAADFTFIHDQNGMQDKATFLTTFEQSICANPDRKPIRMLEGELEVFPLYNEGVLYGAIQRGTHGFWIQEPDTPLYKTSEARFTHVWYFDLETEHWQLHQSLSFDHQDPEPIANAQLRPTRGIRSMLQTPEGDWWFSGPDYVCRYDGQAYHYFGAEQGLPVTGNLHLGPQGHVLVTLGPDIYAYNGDRFTLLSQTPNARSTTGPLWLQLHEGDQGMPGVLHVDSASTTYHAYPVPPTVGSSSLYYPSTPAVQGKDGTVWLGTMEAVFGFNNGTFTTLDRAAMGRQNDKRNVGIRGIHMDRNNRLWMADNGAGVFVYDGTAVTNFTRAHGLDEDQVDGPGLYRTFCVHQDAHGNMWFGTVEAGVWRYNPTDHAFTQFTEKDGLDSAVIWTIYAAQDGTLHFAGEHPGAVYTFDGVGFVRRH